MEKCKKSYTLTDEQKEKSSRIVMEIRKKFSKYDSIICESVFDAGVYFEPTDDDLKEIDEE